MARGNGRQDIVYDDVDRQRVVDGLESTVGRYGWEVFSYVVMTNHLHAFFRTPQPNLSRGMQYWLSGYATWWCRRHSHQGHLFQGRFKGELVEDETYFWTVSRYIHLNPVRAGLVDHPVEWPWSSYAGYAHRRRRVPWICYDTLLRAWQGEFGGSDPARAYRRFVEQGIEQPPASPFADTLHGWILGSQEFAKRLRGLLLQREVQPEIPSERELRGLDVSQVWSAVTRYYGVDPEALAQRGRHTEMRAVAAWLARRHTPATLREMAPVLGLGRAQSVGNLTRRVDESLATSTKLRRLIAKIEAQLADRPPAATKTARRKKKK
jgi:REP element-mobilizing transposase RayT